MTVWVVVADAVQARIFSTEPSRDSLREVRDPAHPEFSERRDLRLGGTAG